MYTLIGTCDTYDESVIWGVANFRDKMIAIREKRKLEKAIKDAWDKATELGLDQKVDSTHELFRYVRQLDENYLDGWGTTKYRLIESRYKTIL